MFMSNKRARRNARLNSSAGAPGGARLNSSVGAPAGPAPAVPTSDASGAEEPKRKRRKKSSSLSANAAKPKTKKKSSSLSANVAAKKKSSSCPPAPGAPSSLENLLNDLPHSPPLLVLAPMVGGSELAFRQLTRKYGADIAYTPMLCSKKFASSNEYRQQMFHADLDNSEDASLSQQHPTNPTPLVLHLCGNCPDTLLRAVKHVESNIAAVDLNLGCPQRIAHAGHFGSYLLADKDRPLLKRIVATLAKHLTVPVFCKIRLVDGGLPNGEVGERKGENDDDNDKRLLLHTLQLVRDLRDSGAGLIAIHARVAGTPDRRREGPANLSVVKKIIQKLRKEEANIPILTNGNCRDPEDVRENLESTNAAGLMAAEGLLDNPALFEFHKALVTTPNDFHALTKHLTPFHLTAEYLENTKLNFPPKDPDSKYGGGFATVRFHCRRILKVLLKEVGLYIAFEKTRTITEIEEVVALCKRACAEKNFAKQKSENETKKQNRLREILRESRPEMLLGKLTLAELPQDVVVKWGRAVEDLDGVVTSKKKSKAKVVEKNSKAKVVGRERDGERQDEKITASQRNEQESEIDAAVQRFVKQTEEREVAEKQDKRFVDRMARKAKRENRSLDEVVAEHKAKSGWFGGGSGGGSGSGGAEAAARKGSNEGGTSTQGRGDQGGKGNMSEKGWNKGKGDAGGKKQGTGGKQGKKGRKDNKGRKGSGKGGGPGKTIKG